MRQKKILACLLSIVTALQVKVITNASTDNEMVWKIQKSLPIEETSSNWEFKVADFNKDAKEDLFCIKKDSGNHTTLHILNGENDYASFIAEMVLPIENTDSNWNFELGDYNKDGIPDLFCIKKNAGNHTNVHILNGADNYQSFLKQVVLPIENTDSNWDFKVGDYDRDGISDLYCLKKNAPNHTNLHILSGASAFQNFSLQVALPIENTDKNWEFGLGDFNDDKIPDLYCIKKNCGTSTNIHILGGNNYQSFLLQIPTILHATGENTEFAVGKGKLDIYCIKKNGTSSHQTELHKFGYKDIDPLEVKRQALDAKRQAIVAEARNHLKKPYVYGAKGPNTFDCSGLTAYVYRQVLKIEIGASTYDQIYSGIEVSQSELKPGDLVFPHDGHVGIFIGDGKMIHAPQTGDVVKISPVYRFWRARRIIY